jgi:hypothetical protein
MGGYSQVIHSFHSRKHSTGPASYNFLEGNLLAHHPDDPSDRSTIEHVGQKLRQSRAKTPFMVAGDRVVLHDHDADE